MSDVKLSLAIRNAILDLVADAVDAGSAAGYFEVYAADGDGVPATVDTAITDQTLLFLGTFDDPAFGSAAAGAVAAAAMADVVATDTGTGGFCRVYDSAATPIIDLLVGGPTSTKPVKIDPVAVVDGTDVQIVSFTLTLSGT